jgi:hypothetical protein
MAKDNISQCFQTQIIPVFCKLIFMWLRLAWLGSSVRIAEMFWVDSKGAQLKWDTWWGNIKDINGQVHSIRGWCVFRGRGWRRHYLSGVINVHSWLCLWEKGRLEGSYCCQRSLESESSMSKLLIRFLQDEEGIIMFWEIIEA